MNRLSDEDFSAQIDILEDGEQPPAAFFTDDIDDLKLARKLFTMQKQPSPHLIASIQHIPITKKQRKMPLSTWRLPVMRYFRLSFAFFILCLMLIFALSTTTQAMVQEITKKIGAFIFQETTAIPPSATPGAETENRPMTMTRSQAQGFIPFLLELPQWLPDGYSFTDQVVLAGSSTAGIDGVFLTWEKQSSDDWIMLIVRKTKDTDVEGNPESPIDVGSIGTVKEVKIHAYPAVIVQGHWDIATGKWNNSGLTLRWWEDDMFYSLHTPDQNLTMEDLVHIGESIP